MPTLTSRFGGGAPSYGGQAEGMLNEARAAGIFDPTGRRLRDMLARRAMLRYRAGQSRAGLLGQLYGLDPSQQRAAQVQQGIMGQEGLAGALNEADLQGYGQGSDFYRNLFMGGLDFERQRQLQKEAEKRQKKGFWGQVLGTGLGIAGSLIGGPVGGAVGSAVGSGMSRAPSRMEQERF